MKKKIEEIIKRLLAEWKPPERITVWKWADNNRILQGDSSAEPGRWHSERTPYMIPIMEAFTDPKVSEIFVKASAQVGKSEFLNNCFGYVVDVDPGPILWVHPTVESGEDYSKQRLTPFIRSTPCLKQKIAAEKSRDKNNTIAKKSFVGGSLSIVGSNAPSGLRSRPIRYVFGDELDAWAISAGKEGDPLKLAEKRTDTFFNRKIVVVSTPTNRERENGIESLYLSGTQEEWRVKCPSCGEYHFIHFDDIVFDKEKIPSGRKIQYEVKSVYWVCKSCGAAHTEGEMKRQPGKMVANNIKALEKGIRSFRLNAWVSPWRSWDSIVEEFLYAHKDPLKLQVVYNTLFGEPFENRGESANEEILLARREEYGAELPEGVLVLTCGVDTQDNRLEYEVVGHGRYNETWGIKKGIIMGRPDTQEVWEDLDAVLNHGYRFADGKELKISMTCVDSGGHYTHEVYNECRKRQANRVFAIRGRGGDGIPFTVPPKQAQIIINERYLGTCWYYNLGVDAGKAIIMSSLKVQTPGPKYCHFPIEEDRGYDAEYFSGLLSEGLVLVRRGGRDK